MSLQGFYTAKGLALAAKLAAGTKLTITKVTAGSGTTAASASVLANTRQTLTVGTAQTADGSATLPVTLTEAGASTSYSLAELGVYADDPDEGEVLYQVFRLSEARTITAGGESVYRFYLKQTVDADGVSVTCSPAGLITEEDLSPVRSKVFATGAPSRAVTVAAADLAAYVAALPRILGENLTITVTGGTLSTTLNINFFTGPGRLTIQAVSGETVMLAGGVQIVDNGILVILIGMTVSGLTSNKDNVYIYCAKHVILSGCICVGDSTSSTGLEVTQGSCALAIDCEFTNHKGAVQSAHTSQVSLRNCTGRNNTVGVSVAGGCTYLYGTPELLGGSSNYHESGLIVKTDGTLL